MGQTRSIRIRLCKSTYEKEAILAVNYAMSGWCSNYIEPGPDGYYDIIMEPLADNPYEQLDLERVKQCFQNELTNQQLRLDLEKKFGPLRELIVRHAFSPLEDLETEVEKLVGRV